jgi:hypothetical protein
VSVSFPGVPLFKAITTLLNREQAAANGRAAAVARAPKNRS